MAIIKTITADIILFFSSNCVLAVMPLNLGHHAMASPSHIPQALGMASAFPDTTQWLRRTVDDDPNACPPQQFWIATSAAAPYHCTLWWDLNRLHASLQRHAGDKRSRKDWLLWLGGVLEDEKDVLHRHGGSGDTQAFTLCTGSGTGPAGSLSRCTSLALLLCYWAGSGKVRNEDLRSALCKHLSAVALRACRAMQLTKYVLNKYSTAAQPPPAIRARPGQRRYTLVSPLCSLGGNAESTAG